MSDSKDDEPPPSAEPSSDAKTPRPELKSPKTIHMKKVDVDNTIDTRPTGEWRTRITKVQVVKSDRSAAAGGGGGDSCLVLIYPPGPDMGKRFPLTRNEIVLGRGSDCDIQVDRDSVSRRHARVFRTGESWTVEDMQSTNGSYVNDVPISKSVLRDGDFVKIGAAIFKFLSGSGIEASYHEEIYRMTIMDALTGAHNKRYFLEYLEREMYRALRFQRPLSLVLLDLDHFKGLNEKHGHLTGDYVLRELARRVLAYIGDGAEKLFARYGGEEFALALPETDLAGARTIAEEVRRLVATQPFEYEGDTIPVTISLGVATTELDEETPVADFIKVAEDNLFRAKREGRNRVIAGLTDWHLWRADPALITKLTPKSAVVALTLLGRDKLLATPGGAATVDNLEGLLYTRFHNRPKAAADLTFGEIEGGTKLLVACDGRNPAHRLRASCFEALRTFAEERPEAQFALGAVRLVGSSEKPVEEAVAALDEELSSLENGQYLPQPVAVSVRALDTLTPARAKFVLEAAETLLQWIALCATADLLAEHEGPKTRAALRRNLAGGVTMGRWNELLVTAVKELLDASPIHKPVWTACFGDKKARTDLFNWFNSVVELRNAFAHGATASDEHVARKIVDEVAPKLLRHIKTTLRPALALIPSEVELVGFEGDLQSYRMTRLIGDGGAASVLVYSGRRMNPGLWLCDAIADRAVLLEPFFLRDTCPKCGARELFLLTRVDELEFRNPATNHVLRKSLDDLPLSIDARDRLAEIRDAS